MTYIERCERVARALDLTRVHTFGKGFEAVDREDYTTRLTHAVMERIEAILPPGFAASDERGVEDGKAEHP